MATMLQYETWPAGGLLTLLLLVSAAARDTISPQLTLATLAPPSPRCCMRWTQWINADRSTSDGGDFETLGYNLNIHGGYPGRVTRYLARLGIQCNTPPKIQCRDAVTKQPWYTTNDYTVFPRRINCDNERGLICKDSEQADGRCHDYEIRLLCFVPCENRVSWSVFFDKDNPSGSGDYERPGLHDHVARHAIPCRHGCSPLDIECYTTSGQHAALSSNKGVTCDNNNGLSCVNSNQPAGTSCQDYKVRYLCGDPS